MSTVRVSREEQVIEVRPARVPVSEANKDKLFVVGLDNKNYMYRWVNDTEDRLATFIAGYWEFVDQNGNPVGNSGSEQSAGTSSKYTKGVGRGVNAYLMRIPMEFWLEDQNEKERKLKETEAASVAAAKRIADYGRLDNVQAQKF